MAAHVAIDATPLGSGRGGDETYMRTVLQGLGATAEPGDRIRVLLRPGAGLPAGVPEGDGRFTTEQLRSGGPVRLLTLGRTARRTGRGGESFLGYTHLPVAAPDASVLVVTDLSFRHHPEHYPRTTRLRLNALVPRQARRARVVVTLSEFCRDDLVDSYGLDADRVVVVPCAAEPQHPADGAQTVETQTDAARTASARADSTRADSTRADDVQAWAAAQGLARAPFVLYLGNLHPRKNVRRLIEAFGQAAVPDVRLVIAGGRWWAGGGEEQEAARAAPGSVLMTGRVTDAQRAWLLRSASAVAYPSLFEGFGLPPLEAMAVGTPVLSSDAAALPETCGDAALLVDASDTAALADGLVRVLTDADLRARLRTAGPARARAFSVHRTGQAARRALALADAVG